MPKYSYALARWRKFSHYFRRRGKGVVPKKKAYALWRGNKKEIQEVGDALLFNVHQAHPSLVKNITRAKEKLARAEPIDRVAVKTELHYFLRQEAVFFAALANQYAASQALDLLNIPHTGMHAQVRKKIVSFFGYGLGKIALDYPSRTDSRSRERRQSTFDALYPLLGNQSYEFIADAQRIYANISRYQIKSVPAP